MMDFTTLQSVLHTLDVHFKIEAGKSVNRLLTMRNWLFGFYIFHYQQNGADRAAYGERLLEKLAGELKTDGFSYRNLKLYRQFYLAYRNLGNVIAEFLSRVTIGQSLTAQLQLIDNQAVEIWQTLSAKSVAPISQSVISQLQPVDSQSPEIVQTPSAQSVALIGQTLSGQLQLIDNQASELAESSPPIGQTVSAQLGASPEKLISSLSFSHITLLLTCESPLQRAFYEIESIRGSWTVRELKRQIGTLLFERTGLSKDKDELLRRVHEQAAPPKPADFIRSPYLFEFLGLPESKLVEESDLEQALIDHLIDFMLELGTGFCFEARQKRMLIGEDWYFADLVFYHRILRCHIIVDLKTKKFKPKYAGQMNAYLNFFRENIMQPGDNEPVGLLLCSGKSEAAVRYAIGGMDEQIFVSRYKLLLPDEETLRQFIERERELLG